MYYRINVSKGRGHVFATADHSLTSRIAYLEVLPLIMEKFPASEGYMVTATYWELRGETMDLAVDLLEIATA